MRILCLMIWLLPSAIVLGQSDFEALLLLKKGIRDDPGKVLDSWDSKSLASNGCPENWYGVVCLDGRIASLTINEAGLAGSFSFPVLSGLENLRNLSVSGNRLKGTISNVGLVKSLEVLDLSGNLFHGAVPSSIGNLKNLVLLNLSSNSFQGIVPSSLGNLERLSYLDLQGNSFSGDVMDLLSKMGGVLHADLSKNQFSGSLDLGLANSSFVTSIQHLNISQNSLVGELFSHDGMPYFDSLEAFDASDNQLVGVIPPFQFVVSLRVLRLGNNQLSGSVPEALLQESSMVLSELDLSRNQLEGPVGSITSATLRKLNVSSNKLSGSLPVTVGHCAVIDMSNNLLSGNLSRIQSWGDYVELIQLSSNALTGTWPNQTSKFLRLTSLVISNNSLSGELPSVLGTYAELQAVDLSFNGLNGFLPPELFSSATLTDINLSANNFTGPLPLTGIQDSSQNLSLVSLDLSLNSLNGSLPSELSKFRNLLYLDLSHNNIDGNIPDGLSDGLKGLNLSYNNLSGSVPDSLQRFPDTAFHPGNDLLAFPNSSLSPMGPQDLNLRDRHSRMKPAVRIALIVGMIGVASTMALFSILIYYRRNCERKSLRGEKGREWTTREPSPLYVSEPQLPSNSQQGRSPSAHKGFPYDFGATSSVTQKPEEQAESIRKGEGLSSPLSVISSSSNPSPSKSGMSPGTLMVYSPDKLAGDLHVFDSSLMFSLEELSAAPSEVIGRSCHGALYKATLDSGKLLAIKWLKEGIAKGKKEFTREVKKLGNIRHPNLVSVRGYYWGLKEHERIIISNYIDAQCLAFHLREEEPKELPPLSLEDRIKIAVNVARCLNYLHNERAIPHGNLKSTNILLDPSSMDPLLTDYSLHRLLTSAGTAEQVLNAGALGYRPPEFASSSKPCPSLKSDVYAFGVILLELITGRCSGEIVSVNPGVVDLTEWVRLVVEQNHSDECFDKSLISRPNTEAPRILDEMLQVALRCILPASERPDIKAVFENLSMIVP